MTNFSGKNLDRPAGREAANSRDGVSNISLEQAQSLSIAELAAIPGPDLMAVQAEAAALLAKTKSLKSWVDGAIAQKYEARAQVLRQLQDKQTGIIRFDDDGLEVCADIAKRPKWNQEKLADIAERVRVNGEDPLEFMAVTYKVPESKYNSWPAHLRSIFVDARTLDVGKQTFALALKEDK